jgi:hypothetical protein
VTKTKLRPDRSTGVSWEENIRESKAGHWTWTVCAVALVLISSAVRDVRAQTVSFVAPPRTIADISAILDQQKPDPALVAKLRAGADAQPGGGNLADFYFSRAQARWALGRSAESIADTKQAIEIGRNRLTCNAISSSYCKNT